MIDDHDPRVCDTRGVSGIIGWRQLFRQGGKTPCFRENWTGRKPETRFFQEPETRTKTVE